MGNYVADFPSAWASALWTPLGIFIPQTPWFAPNPCCLAMPLQSRNPVGSILLLSDGQTDEQMAVCNRTCEKVVEFLVRVTTNIPDYARAVQNQMKSRDQLTRTV